ncbi:hypothetical protein ACSFC1_02000 [Pseudothermotoga sp. U03pept]|uniref:hypothetical protein n=1 Tax=Pseudothermotoga sp. U03pept TaxID=3447012 RepID=UPI003F08ABC7
MTVQVLIYFIVSIFFITIAYVVLDTTITHFRTTLQRIDKETDLFMTVDFLRRDFWFHSVSTGCVSQDGSTFTFKEKIDGQEKQVRYFVERDDSFYQLRRIANDGINVVYKSAKPISFSEPVKGIWAITIEDLQFEMVNATPTELMEKLYKGKVKTPEFLLPKLIEVRNR